MAKIKFYATLTIIVTLSLILGIQTFRLWLRGVEHSPAQSMYRVKPTRMASKPLDPPRGSEASTRQVQGFVAPPSPTNVNPGFTIGRWELENIPCNRNVVVEVSADDTGRPSATWEIRPQGVGELGYLRELSLFYSRSLSLSRQLETSMEIGVEYSHDLFRLGPVWVSGRLSGGWERLRLPDGSTVDGVKVMATGRVGVRF